MPIDTGPLLAALDPPVFTHEGIEYRGRHLSILEWARYMERMAALGHQKLGLVGQQRFYRALCDAWFPPPKRRHWLASRPPSVGDLVLTLPRAVQDEVLASFIRSQQRSMGLVPAAGSTTMAPTT